MAQTDQTPASAQPTRQLLPPGWAMALGAILAFAGIKDVLRRIKAAPAAVRALHVSRREGMIAIVLLFRTLARAGAGALGGGRL
jgi:hypothetical protein